MKSKFHALEEYDRAFDVKIEVYNGKIGLFEAKVHMGPIELPQRKGRLPQYPGANLLELQERSDKLEALGVFKRPEEIDISVEYLNPSFLFKNSNGGYRLVTA